VKPVETNEPAEGNFPAYRKQYEVFKRSYESLENVFSLIAGGTADE
jgi:hypothetical protein